MFLTEDEILMGWWHWSICQCEIFNFVDLSSGVGIVWSTTVPTWSVMSQLLLSSLNLVTN